MHEMVRGVMTPSSSHQINVLLTSENLFKSLVLFKEIPH